MFEQTCAACNCNLDANSIKVRIVFPQAERSVCLRERGGRGLARDPDGVNLGVPNLRRRNVEPASVSTSGMLAIGLFLGAAMLAYPNPDARMVASIKKGICHGNK